MGMNLFFFDAGFSATKPRALKLFHDVPNLRHSDAGDVCLHALMDCWDVNGIADRLTECLAARDIYLRLLWRRLRFAARDIYLRFLWCRLRFRDCG
jgi:hypothetical protein